MTTLISVEEAQCIILSKIQIGPVELTTIEQGLNRVLAGDIYAHEDMPPYSNSSMDGFAVRYEDIRNASNYYPVVLDVIGEIPAGSSPEISISSGKAARIMTGGILPLGADTVIPFEDIQLPGPEDTLFYSMTIQVTSPLPLASNIRPKGQDWLSGTPLLNKSHRIRPQDIGLLAAMGLKHVKVYSKPRVAIFSTGDELIKPGAVPVPGKIYESNSYMLSALAESFGAAPFYLGNSPDEPEKIEGKLSSAIQYQADLIVSSGGVSVGRYDYVRQVVTENGYLDFWKVNVRPGKPLAFGAFKRTPFIGLPGNPVSSFVSFHLFVLPAIRRMLGLNPHERHILKVELEHPVQSDGRESYLRVALSMQDGKFFASTVEHQGSGNIKSLIEADALLILPSGVKSHFAGEKLNALVISNYSMNHSEE